MTIKLGTIFNHKFKVTKETSNLFINLSQDRNPLHVDDNFSISKGFKSKVTHGNIQNCFLSYFVIDHILNYFFASGNFLFNNFVLLSAIGFKTV